MTWAAPLFLIIAAAILVLLVVAYALDFARRRRQLEKIGHAPQLLKMAQSVSPGRRGVKAALVVVAATLIAVSIARPQTRGEAIWRERGIDIVIALDMSKSMLVQDVYPSRARVAKLIADSLIDALGGHRVGLVAFGGTAVHFPLTSDHEAARTFYHGVSPGDLPAGTSLAGAVLAGRCLLVPSLAGDPDCRGIRGGGPGGDAPGRRGDPAGRKLEVADTSDRARALIVFTDAEDTEGGAKEEIAKAAQLGIQIYFVAVGTPAGGTIPEVDEDGRILSGDSARHVSRVDEAFLKELAQAAGGEDHYFRANPRKLRLESLENALKKLKEGDLEERTVNVPVEVYQFFLYAAFLALIYEACMSDRRREKRGARK